MDFRRFAQEIRPAVYEAGKIALKHFQKITAEQKRSYVTIADRGGAVLAGGDQGRFPEHGFIGEETGDVEKELVWASIR